MDLGNRRIVLFIKQKTKALISCAVTLVNILVIEIYEDKRFMCQVNFGSQFMSLVVRKPAFCICENKDADQLRGDREADQRLCFGYTDSTMPRPPNSEISSL